MPAVKVDPPASVKARAAVVRPRDAASLILLRGEGSALEVLAGRRPLNVKFMPGVYVFPGGAIDPPDRIAWSVETGTEALGPRLARSRPRGIARDLGGSGCADRPAGPVCRRLHRRGRRSSKPISSAAWWQRWIC